MWRLKSGLPKTFNDRLGNGARDLVMGESRGTGSCRVSRGRNPRHTDHTLAIETFLVHIARHFIEFWQVAFWFGESPSISGNWQGSRGVNMPACVGSEVKEVNTHFFRDCRVQLSSAFSSISMSWTHSLLSPPCPSLICKTLCPLQNQLLWSRFQMYYLMFF